MLRAAWKSVLGRKWRLLFSAMAIVLGIAFVAGTLIFTDSMSNSLKSTLSGNNPDITITPSVFLADPGTPPSPSDAPTRPLNNDDIERAKSVRDVASVNPVVTATAAPPTLDGRPIPDVRAVLVQPWTGAPLAHQEPNQEIIQGRPPKTGDEFAVDRITFEKAGFHLGERVSIEHTQDPGDKGPPKQEGFKATVVGVMEPSANAEKLHLGDYAFPLRTVQDRFLDGSRDYQSLAVAVAPGASVDDVAARLKANLPPGYTTATAEEITEKTGKILDQALGFMRTFLLVFAAISLIVGAFLIVNTFSILVAQRSRELALLRAVGASSRQVLASVLFEAFVVGLAGSLLGLLLGVGLTRLIQLAVGAFMPGGGEIVGQEIALTPSAVLICLGLGISITMLAALMPSFTAARVPPVTAMGGDVATGTTSVGARVKIGTALTVVGLPVLAAAVWWSGVPGSRGLWLGAGALAVLVGVTLISPAIGAPVLFVMGFVYRAIFRTIGKLAILNAVRNPRRTAATASALMIGLMLVTLVNVLGQSAKASVLEGLRADLRAPVTVNATYDKPITQRQLADARRSPQIGDVVTSSTVKDPVTISEYWTKKQHQERDAALERTKKLKKGEKPPKVAQQRTAVAPVAGYEPGGLGRISKIDVTSGESRVDDHHLLLSDHLAQQVDAKVGDRVQVTLGDKPRTFTVGGITEASSDLPGMGQNASPPAGVVVSSTVLDRFDAKPRIDRLGVYPAPGVSSGQVTDRMRAIVSASPQVTVTDEEQTIRMQGASLDVIFGLITALLALAIIIAILGIINTLSLSVMERTREMGLLRAVGMLRGQLRRMITLEAVVIAVLGAVLGMAMGVLFGAAAQHMLKDQGLNRLVIPWPLLAAFFVAAVVVGVLAAWWPAVRAARQNVLRAITAE